MFTAKNLFWVLKEQRQSWDGVHFHEITLQQHVIPLLPDPHNVFDTREVIFLHDEAPWMKANTMPHFLENQGVKSWGNSIWFGNSPDMHSAENFRGIIKDKIEEVMASEVLKNRYSYDELKTNIDNTLTDVEDNTDLFIDLLCSMEKDLILSKLLEKVIQASETLS